MNPAGADPQPRVHPYAAMGVGILAVSTGAIFARLADAPALVTAAYRVGLAVLLLAPPAWLTARRELLSLGRRDLVLAGLSGLFLALHFAFWISSLDYTTVSSSVVLVDTNPLWVGLLTPFVTGDRLRPVMVVSIVVSVVGGVLIGAGDFAAGGRALWGDALALAGGVSAAAYLLLGRRLRAHLSLLPYVTVCYGAAAVILWALVLALGQPVTGFSTGTWASFGGLALISQVVGHTSYNWALKWCSAGLIAVSLLGEPVISSIIAYFLFDEGFTLLKVMGGGCVLVSIYLAARAEAPAE